MSHKGLAVWGFCKRIFGAWPILWTKSQDILAPAFLIFFFLIVFFCLFVSIFPGQYDNGKLLENHLSLNTKTP